MGNELFDDIKDRGAAAVQEMCDRHDEESLHLEFKTLGGSDGVFTKDDRSLVAKAICGLANAEGGLIVLGVVTKKLDGVDVADRPQLLDRLSRRRRHLLALGPDLLASPVAIEVEAVPAGPDDQGFLVVRVPESDRRPHMSQKHHAYFRRTSDGTRVMEHGEVRDMFFAPREARLELIHDFHRLREYEDGSLAMLARWGLKNTGVVTARSVFLRITKLSKPHPAYAAEMPFLEASRGGDVVMVTAEAGSILHVGDEHLMVHMTTIIMPVPPKRYGPDAGTLVIDPRRSVSPPYWKMGRSYAARGELSDEFERIELKVTFGAENAASVTEDFSFSVAEIVSAANLLPVELNSRFNKGIPAELLRWREEDS